MLAKNIMGRKNWLIYQRCINLTNSVTKYHPPSLLLPLMLWPMLIHPHPCPRDLIRPCPLTLAGITLALAPSSAPARVTLAPCCRHRQRSLSLSSKLITTMVVEVRPPQPAFHLTIIQACFTLSSLVLLVSNLRRSNWECTVKWYLSKVSTVGHNWNKAVVEKLDQSSLPQWWSRRDFLNQPFISQLSKHVSLCHHWCNWFLIWEDQIGNEL